MIVDTYVDMSYNFRRWCGVVFLLTMNADHDVAGTAVGVAGTAADDVDNSVVDSYVDEFS